MSGVTPKLAISRCYRWPATAGLLWSMVSLLPAQTTEWVYHKTEDGLHPDANEQQLVWLMNRARANPTAEGEFLAASGDPDIHAGITFFNVNTTQLRNEFAAIVPKPPAAFDRRLYEASRVHSLDLIARDAQDHNSQFNRVTAAGFMLATGRASVFSYGTTAIETHAALNIDWGGPASSGGMQVGRGHRVAIMSDQPSLLSNVGFAAVLESNPTTEVGPIVFSGAYCQAQTNVANHHNRFLVGTVWADANSNNRYDAGEGLANVRVQPNQGPFHAITGVAGGWAIPITSPATYTLTFSGTTLAGTPVRTAVVGAESVLVDVIGSRAVPPMTISYQVEGSGNIRLTWSGGRAPWQVQQTTNLASGWSNLGPPTSTNTVSIPRSGPKQFYRVITP